MSYKAFKWKSAETNLIRPKHVFVEDITSDLVDGRVRDPCSVVTSGDFADLVCPNLVHGDFVGLCVGLDGNLCRHTTHCCDFPSMAELVYKFTGVVGKH